MRGSTAKLLRQRAASEGLGRPRYQELKKLWMRRQNRQQSLPDFLLGLPSIVVVKDAHTR